MSASVFEITAASSPRAGCARQTGFRQSWWAQHREASLNWLALGLLLAAWNASDDNTSTQSRPRPEALRGYSYVSVRAAALYSAELHRAPED